MLCSELAVPCAAHAADIPLDDSVFTDAVLREHIISNFDSDESGTLSAAEIKSITGLSLTGKGITNLKGIECLTSLERLWCDKNGIVSVDLSKNTALKELYIGSNKLTSLDVSSNTELTVLSCYSNKLKALDLTYNTKLDTLYCYANKIKSIDISKIQNLRNAYHNGKFSTDNVYDTYNYNKGWAVIKVDAAVTLQPHSYYIAETKPATLEADGQIIEKCIYCGDSKTAPISKIASVTLSTKTYTYNGKAKKPSVTVKDSGGNVLFPSWYTVSYPSGRIKVGEYKVKVKFYDNYSATKTLSFKIKPSGVSVKSLTAKPQGFKLKWKKKTAQTDGYQIQYARNSKFTKSKKTVTVNDAKQAKLTVKKLKKGKKYYVRIRAFKYRGEKRYCSKWSKAKSIKTE